MPRTGRTPGHAGRCRSSRRAPSGPYRRERRSPPAPVERTRYRSLYQRRLRFSSRARRADRDGIPYPITTSIERPPPLCALRRADSVAVDPVHRGLSQGGKGQALPPRSLSLAASPSDRGSFAKSRLFPKGKAADGETGTPPGCHVSRRRSEEKGVVAAHAFRRERRIDHEPFHKSALVTPPRCYDREHDESYRGGVSRHGSQTI